MYTQLSRHALRVLFCAWILLFAVASFTRAASVGTKTSTTAAPPKSGAKVDLNTADEAALQALPGVGPVTARAIIAARPFTSVAQLEKVEGIGPVKYSELRDRVTVTRQTKGGKNEAPGKEIAAAKSKGKSGGQAATARKSANAGKVDLNTADVARLEALPGVGPVTAREIVKARPFASVDDLSRVPGIGEAKLATLRDQVTVSSRPLAPSRPSTTNSEPALEPTGRPSARPGAAPATTTLSQTRVNLNTATREELEALPEIGPVKAQAIIDARPFSTVEDVMRVSGIKEATFEAIRDRITVR